MKTFLFASFLFLITIGFSQPVIEVEEFATGLTAPLGLVNCGDDRVFAVCQEGWIMIIDPSGVVKPVPFLDIESRVSSNANAHGLLGVVFHPEYATNGYFYVNYINLDLNSVIARFSVSLADPDIADTTSEEILLTVTQPYTVHKGGDIHFGPDGYLYFPFGDGGVALPDGPGDPDNRAQNPTTLLGKMLRIDVDGALPYITPATNPFYGATDTLSEIWSIGLRNPWRFSFDRLTGDMWLPDVGHDLWEEINFEPAGFSGGNNYGWRCYEGSEEYNFDSCDAGVDYTFPLFEYPHNDSTGGYSVTGGYVYRGADFPGLYGIYICCDYVTGNFYTYKADGLGGYIYNIYDFLLEGVVSFGEDAAGEMYCVVRNTGIIYKITDLCGSFNAASIVENENCGLADGAVDITVSDGNAPFYFEWINTDTTQDISLLDAGMYSVIITDAIGCIIMDTFNVLTTPDIEINLEVLENENCGILNDGSISLIVSGGIEPYQFEWSNGETTEDISSLDSGVYQVTVIDSAGCILVEMFTVEFEGVFDVTILVSGDQLTALPAGDYTYQWFLNGNLIIGANSSEYVATEAGNYSVIVTDVNGCAISSIEVLVNVGIIESELPNLIIYPNPADYQLQFQFFNAVVPDQIQIINSYGKIIYSNKFIPSSINTLSFANGIYYIKVIDDKKLYSSQFTIIH